MEKIYKDTYNSMDMLTQAKQMVNTLSEHREWVLWCLLLSLQNVSTNYIIVKFMLCQYFHKCIGNMIRPHVFLVLL